MKYTFSLFLSVFLMLSWVNVNAQAELWGTASQGGMDNIGTVFKSDESGNNFSVVRSFQFAINRGATPESPIIEPVPGVFYGVTNQGGTNHNGVIYKWDKNNNIYTVLHQFTPGTGTSPRYGITMAGNGKLYGQTLTGGPSNSQVIYEYNLSTSIYSVIYQISTGTIGSNPSGELKLASNGKLYGLMKNGGANGVGTIFELDPATNTVSKKVDLSSSVGYDVYGSFVEVNQNLYAAANLGGANGVGSIIEYSLSSSALIKKYDFVSGLGSKPRGTPFYDAVTNKLYGISTLGGINNNGVLYSYTIGGIFNQIYSFTASVQFGMGSVLRLPSGMIYFTLNSGLVEFNENTSTLTTILGGAPDATPLLGSNGKIYTVIKSGGRLNGTGWGEISEFDPASGVEKAILGFNISDGAGAFGPLTTGSNRKLYGVTNAGGTSGAGVIYEIDPLTNVYTVRQNFTVGQTYRGKLLAHPNGKIYGMTGNSVFSYDPSTDTYTKFPGTGASVYGSILLHSNGKLYFTPLSGGTGAQGSIVEFDIASGIYTVKGNFSSISGSQPMGMIVEHSNGNIYGTTARGGNNNKGLIWEFNPASSFLTARYHFNTGSGTEPEGGVIIGPGGRLLGATTTGGSLQPNYGSIYEYNPLSGSYVEKYSFTGPTGTAIRGPLFKASNGLYYGLSYSGGTTDDGTFFEYDANSSTLAVKHNFNKSTTGEFPYASITEVCITPALDAITGPAIVCGDGNPVAYSVPAVAGALAYFWTIPANATIISGAGTNNISVIFTGAGTGEIMVSAVNECNGPASRMNVDVKQFEVSWPTVTSSTKFRIGETVQIQMTDIGSDCHSNLEFTSNGVDWIILKTGLTSADQNYSWKVPDMESTNCQFRIAGSTSPVKYSSSQIFTIYSPLPYKAIDFIGQYNTINPNPLNPQNAAEPGYPLRFKLQIKNDRAINLLTLKGIIRTTNPMVHIIDSSGTFNNILSGSKGWSVDEYEILLHSNTPDNMILEFDLVVTDQIDGEDPWTSGRKIRFPVNVMEIPAIVFDDDNIPDSKGNDNDIAEKDEVIEILPLLRNKSNIQFDKAEGTLTTTDSYINIWNNKSGATGTVFNKYKYNSIGGNHTPVLPLATNMTPEEDYVFDYTGSASFSFDFRMLMLAELTEFMMENPVAPGTVAPKIRYGLPFGLNKGFPKPIAVDITSPSNGSTHNIGSVITVNATVTSSLAVDSVVFSVNGVMQNAGTTNSYSYNWNTSSLTAGTYILTVMAVDQSKNRSTDQVSITITETPSGFSDHINKSGIKIYPNPSKGSFVIADVKSEGHLIISDLTGRELQKISLNKGVNNINSNELASGCYLLKIMNDEGITVSRIIIK